jgi:predicted DNA-binding transcriptional regulator AlpA
MAKKMRSRSPAKRKANSVAKVIADPRQLGLFDAFEGKPSPPARKLLVKRAKPKRISADGAQRPVVLSPREAAQYLGVSVSTLKHWRAKNIGPKWRHRGARLVAYRPADLEQFLDDNTAKR